MRSTLENLQVIYEDNHLIAINKRAGDIVQGDKTGDKPLVEVVKEYIAKKHDKPGAVFLGIPHRLDRPTSGVIVFARTSKALSRLNKILSNREVEKKYWAIVKSAPPKLEDTLVHFLKRNPKQNKSYSYDKEIPESKKGILHYRLVKSLNNYFLLEIDLETGRHHQIRSQLSAIGSPIKGDLKYGFARSNPDGGIHLHARSIHFIHPVSKEEISIEAQPPEDVLWNACV